jgi:hypothetical protein
MRQSNPSWKSRRMASFPPTEDRETYTVFLVPVSDPTDEYVDEEGNTRS